MAVRDDFAPGEVLGAADLNDTFAAKVDYALPTNAQTGTAYTFVADDAERLTTASNGSAVTLTIPPQSSVTWGDDTVLRVVNYGAGAVTIDGGSGVTVTNTATTVAQYGAAVAIRTGSDAWTVVPFGGGDVPSATVSSPAATGQYTDTGVTYDYYTFTSSGTLTVDTAGFADVLVVGGGGGGGNAQGGGGGAGGYLAITDAYLPAGTLTVTVGAGGAGATASTNLLSGANGISSRLASYYGVGGGAGAGISSGANGLAQGFSGGSGGGAAGRGDLSRSGGVGTSGQGNDGGDQPAVNNAGGGGGADAVGGNGSASAAGNGGNGLASSITGSSVTRAGGGGGGARTGSTAGGGGAGGGGAGSVGNAAAAAGSANTGGGGGGGGYTGAGAGGSGGNGGSGVVIVRVKV